MLAIGISNTFCIVIADGLSLLCFPRVVYVTMSCGERMSHNGSGDPMVILDIDTCARFGESTNGGYSLKLIKFFSEELKLPLCRYV